MRLIITPGIFAAVYLLAFQSVWAAETVCSLSAEDKQRNATLTVDEFDQQMEASPGKPGLTDKTWRKLSMHGCDKEAIEAAEDYLLHAQFPSDGLRKQVMFHLAQSLGMAGSYEAAAAMTAATKNIQNPDKSGLDWNTYVEGTWAFFRRDRAVLTSARDTLLSEPGLGNQINGKILVELSACFDKSYKDSYGNTACLAQGTNTKLR